MASIPRKSMPAVDPRLGKAIRTFRERQGRSQEDLAHDADITTAALSRIEGGKSNPAWETVMRVLAALKVSLGELEAAMGRGHR